MGLQYLNELEELLVRIDFYLDMFISTTLSRQVRNISFASGLLRRKAITSVVLLRGVTRIDRDPALTC